MGPYGGRFSILTIMLVILLVVWILEGCPALRFPDPAPLPLERAGDPPGHRGGGSFRG